MKAHILLVLGILLIPTAAQAELFVENNEIAKGETISITGEHEGEYAVVSARLNNRLIFEKRAEISGGKFSLDYNTSALDPSGKWEISIEGTEEYAEVNVKNSVDSGVLAVRFLSPAPEAFARTGKIPVTAEITLDREPEKGLAVNTWTMDGRRITLKETGNGIYSGELSVPYDAQLGETAIITTALQKNGSYGGEAFVYVTITGAPLKISVLEPGTESVIAGKPIAFRVAAEYALDAPADQEIAISGKIGGNALLFEKNPDKSYSAKYTPSEEEEGELHFEITAQDPALNRGSYESSLAVVVPAERRVISFAEKEPAIFTAAVIVLALAVFGGIPDGISALRKRSASKRKEAAARKLKSLQRQYFEEGAISRSDFDAKSAEIEAEIKKIESE